MKTIEFKVAPYALYDTIKAILNQNDKNHYYKITVTKEDGYLVIFATEEQIYHNNIEFAQKYKAEWLNDI